MSLTLKTMLAFEDAFDPSGIGDCAFQKIARVIKSGDGNKMTAVLHNGTQVVFADYYLPKWWCLPVSQDWGLYRFIPSNVIHWLFKNQPTEDVEISFVGGTIVRKQIEEKRNDRKRI